MAHSQKTSGNESHTKKDTLRTVELHSTVRSPIPPIPFERIARSVLGTSYSLSLVICGDTLARRINTETRKKTYSPNVLSFELDAHNGEIILNIRKAEREARRYKTTLKERLILLFVHGCYHLKGYDHGGAMDRLEAATRAHFR
ncbi:rRNA maturation RNase YbeY [bacterium]|nr:rRNA maturation RNase YbeY [bacterium]